MRLTLAAATALAAVLRLSAAFSPATGATLRPSIGAQRWLVKTSSSITDPESSDLRLATSELQNPRSVEPGVVSDFDSPEDLRSNLVMAAPVAMPQKPVILEPEPLEGEPLGPEELAEWKGEGEEDLDPTMDLTWLLHGEEGDPGPMPSQEALEAAAKLEFVDFEAEEKALQPGARDPDVWYSEEEEMRLAGVPVPEKNYWEADAELSPVLREPMPYEPSRLDGKTLSTIRDRELWPQYDDEQRLKEDEGWHRFDYKEVQIREDLFDHDAANLTHGHLDLHVMKKIQPVLYVLGNSVEVLEAHNGKVRFLYHGPVKQMVGVEAYAKYLMEHNGYPEISEVRCETRRVRDYYGTDPRTEDVERDPTPLGLGLDPHTHRDHRTEMQTRKGAVDQRLIPLWEGTFDDEWTPMEMPPGGASKWDTPFMNPSGSESDEVTEVEEASVTEETGDPR